MAGISPEADGPDPAAQFDRLTSLPEVMDVLRSDDFVQAGHRKSSPLTGGTVVKLEGDAHFERRRLESKLFRRSMLAHYDADVIQPYLQSLFAALRQNGHTAVAVSEVTHLTLIRLACRIIGLDYPEPDRAAHLFELSKTISAGHNVDWDAGDTAQTLENALAAKEEYAQEFFLPAWNRQRSLLDQEEPPRQGASKDNSADVSFISLVLDSDLATFDDDLDLVIRESLLFFNGVLGSPRRIFPSLMDELLSWANGSLERQSRLGDPRFLRDTVMEVVRLHTPGSPKLRRAVKEVHLGSGRKIGAGETVAVNIVLADRDPDVFGATADTFEPERNWAGYGARAGGVGFGAGRHMCIGRSLCVGSLSSDSAEPIGVMVRLLIEMFGRGVTTDPPGPEVDGVGPFVDLRPHDGEANQASSVVRAR